jgi:prepilin-type N-terminal cleavage/methylation domain-containing protein
MVSSRSTKRRAFTLLEVLVAVAIVAVLVALLMVGYHKVRGVADRVTTVNNLYNIGVAMQSHHTQYKAFPTEHENPETKERVSFYTQLLPFVEAKNASPQTYIPVYVSPSRRILKDAKRDFGYGSSQANGTVGPTILDNQKGPVSMAMISEGGKSLGESALLAMLWMAPTTYSGGDPTDAGWSQTMNARGNLTAIKKDTDPSGSDHLGGPYESGVPTLFVDGHIAVIPYGVTQSDLASYFAYNTSMTRTCDAWLPPGPDGVQACKGCGEGCQCGCVASDAFVDGFDPTNPDSIRDYLNKKAEDGTLTPEEEDLLKGLDPDAYKDYKDRQKKERSDWEKSVKEKAERGEQLTPEEQDYMDKQSEKDRKNKENSQKNQERKKFEDEAKRKGKEGEEMTKEEKDYYDKWSDGEKKKEERKKWEDETMKKGKGGEDMTPEEKKYFDEQTKKEEDKKQNEWKKKVQDKGKKGETLTEDEQKYYDDYVNQQEQQKAKKEEEARKAEEKKYFDEQTKKAEDKKQNDWKKKVQDKGKKGETLTEEEQKYYDDYVNQQEQQKAKKEEDARKAEEKYQKDLQDKLNQYGDKYAQQEDTSPGGPCGCGFNCCANGTCKCSH